MPRCTGKSKVKDADGVKQRDEHGNYLLKPCQANAMTGQTKCSAHGGRSPQARTKAAERIVEQEARKTLSRIGSAPIADPLTALAQLAGQVVGFKDAVGELVDRLDSIRYEDAKGAEQLRAEVAVFTGALAECRQVLVACARLDIDSRLAAISERQTDILQGAVAAGLAAADVTGEAAIRARDAIARHLRAV